MTQVGILQTEEMETLIASQSKKAEHAQLNDSLSSDIQDYINVEEDRVGRRC